VQIAGVVADLKDRDLVSPPVRRYYVPYLQRPFGDPGALHFVVRTRDEPRTLLAALRSVIVGVDPQLPIDELVPVSTLMRASIREERLLTRLTTGFGAIALVLAAIGLYGVMTYTITRRTGEIGLRVALGAQRRAVVGMILGDAARLLALGVAIGIPLALVAGRMLEKQLHVVKSGDPIAIGGVLVVLAVSGAIAALLPALRASRVAPIEALREE
jgi:ABC-type antimicrobial peptide transport system permease subunit